jgi:hypothetical protein
MDGNALAGKLIPGTRAYIDCVSTAEPTYGAHGRDKKHPIRVSIALEEGRKITGRLNVQVCPEPGWTVEPQWCRRYGANASLARAAGMPPRDVAEAARNLLGTAEVIVGHSIAFHTGLIAQLLVDAGVAGAYNREALGPTFDTMQQTAQDCAIAGTRGKGFKPPRMPEAYLHFTGEQLPDISDPSVTWWQAGLLQLTALRRIWWGKHRWGLAPAIEAEGVP